MEMQFPFILDGATGTELQKRGYTGEKGAEQWVLEHPEVLQEIQRGYAEAGSDAVYASTFSANRQKLEERGIFNQTADMNKRLVAVTREAVGKDTYVGGDIAPSGVFLAPLGNTGFEELVDIYAEQVAGLEAAGVDLYAVETMMTVPDARAAVLAIRSQSTKPVFVTFTCDENGKTLTGTDITAALVILQGMGISAFGLNCSAGPDTMLKNLQRLAPYARIPLIAKPNAGLPEIVNGDAVYNCGPEEFTAYVKDMAAAGVAIFGGCCGTNKTHIAALKGALADFKLTPPNPEHPELLPAATEKKVFLLPPEAGHGEVLRCDGDLEDKLADALEGDEAMVAIRLDSWDELDSFQDVQYMLSKPLCLVCEDGDLLEAALRAYQGRALYEGGLKEEVLAPLRERYGLLT